MKFPRTSWCWFIALALMVGCAEGAVNTGTGDDDTVIGGSDTSGKDSQVFSDIPGECGNNVLESGETCDNGTDNSDTRPNACRTDCSAASCGDGVVDQGESCDDGNGDENDGCLPTCKRVIDIVCVPCTEDFECGRTIDHCTDLPGSKACTIACTGDDDCPTGFSCKTPPGGELNQCLPDGGACVECFDPDNDGYGTGTGCAGFDCNQDVGTVHEGAEELCDGIDNNCDGEVDEGFEARRFWPDADNDTFGDAYTEVKVRCTDLSGHVENDLDCDDKDPNVKPGVADSCDGFDNNCDGRVDDGGGCPCEQDWTDAGDSYLFCSDPLSWSEAEATCAASGYHLTTIQTPEENAWMREIAVLSFKLCQDTCQYKGDSACDDGGSGSLLQVCAFGSDCTDCGPRDALSFWIGLSDATEEGTYTWGSGDPSDYLRWAEAQPSATSDAEDCVEMLTGPHDWNDQDCSIPQAYVCESPLRPERPGEE